MLRTSYLHRHGIAPIERFELSSLLAIELMVREGLGVALVPDIASPLTASLNIARIRLPDPVEPRLLGVLWRRGTARSRLVAALLEQARQERRGTRAAFALPPEPAKARRLSA